MSGKSALLLGATGQVGQHVLKELLSSPDFTKVGEFGRRVTDLSSITTGKDKLVQKTIDFEKLEEAELEEGKWDVVFITLGTSRKAAGSAEAFEKIDREYVINAARAAKADNTPQRIVYVSAIGANASSSFLYPRSKGLTEQGLASLGYDDTIVFRPFSLAGTHRPKLRIAESLFAPLFSLASYITDRAEIQVSTLAKSVVAAGKLGSAALPAAAKATKAGEADALYTLLDNAAALALARSV
ncbi:Oxidoreductase HTATIP2 [Hypsizygus marmoreus]|uniref:Oxidoreductase HTATIP2 n=1 Tax=Hypsizygus marmoreus TaxID=39966 RepID=A0A369JWB4_HYPMA|nr:Oxidoreductase HTATIP2 [Hypsizygus marmoreus]